MPEVNSNYVYPQQNYYQPNTFMPAQTRVSMPELSIKDEFVKQHKKNGLFERLYNGIKNLTGLGAGSKKTKTLVEKAENGEISEEEARAGIDKYRKSQVNGAQAFGDLMSVGAAGLTFFKVRNALKMVSAEMQINSKFYNMLANQVNKVGKKHGKNFMGKLGESILKSGQSNAKMVGVATIAAALVGGFVKKWTLKFNRIGSDEFKYNKKDFNGAKTPYDKAQYKLEKKIKKRERRRTNFRNFLSGAINGLMLPISLLGGAFVGIPLYVAGNSLNRYFVANREEKNKSFKGYIENLKSDGITHAALAAAIAAPMIKKVNFANTFDKNLKKVVENLKDANLKPSGFEGKTTYQELDDILMNSKNIKNIINKGSMEEQIQNLTNENIFAVKFIQIGHSGGLAEALKENCPATRTLEEAQKYINQKLGNGYSVSKCLGVGTIAETYLAKDSKGKEVCIKILKNGISAEKIANDKAKFIDIIKKLPNKTAEEKEFLIRNIEDLAEGISKEVDFNSEMEAAKKLIKHTKAANIVKPIEVKNGVYVMEKANGISLDSLIKLQEAERELRYYERKLKQFKAGQLDDWERIWAKGDEDGFIHRRIESLTNNEIPKTKEKITRIKSRTPDFEQFQMQDADAKYLFEEYMKVMVEQFYKVDKAGKTLHADIHPGNVFIDLNALKSRKGPLFTLIDTGNTIDLSAKQALSSLKLTNYIQKADVPDIVEYMLDGANLKGSGLTKEEAVKKISEDLKNCFFDNKTELTEVNTSNLFTIVSNIMRKHKILPSSNQLNLDKARTSAENSFYELKSIWYTQVGNKIQGKASNAGKVSTELGMVKDEIMLNKKFTKMKANQEKLNLLQFPISETIKYRNNPNLLKENSEEYLTYKLKQKKMDLSQLPDKVD